MADPTTYSGWEGKFGLLYNNSNYNSSTLTLVKSVSVKTENGEEVIYALGSRNPTILKDQLTNVEVTVERTFDTTQHGADSASVFYNLCAANTSGAGAQAYKKAGIYPGGWANSSPALWLGEMKCKSYDIDVSPDKTMVEKATFVAKTAAWGTISSA